MAFSRNRRCQGGGAGTKHRYRRPHARHVALRLTSPADALKRPIDPPDRRPQHGLPMRSASISRFGANIARDGHQPRRSRRRRQRLRRHLHRRERRLRQRRHPGGIADTAGIVENVVGPSRTRWPCRDAADCRRARACRSGQRLPGLRKAHRRPSQPCSKRQYYRSAKHLTSPASVTVQRSRPVPVPCLARCQQHGRSDFSPHVSAITCAAGTPR